MLARKVESSFMPLGYVCKSLTRVHYQTRGAHVRGMCLLGELNLSLLVCPTFADVVYDLRLQRKEIMVRSVACHCVEMIQRYAYFLCPFLSSYTFSTWNSDFYFSVTTNVHWLCWGRDFAKIQCLFFLHRGLSQLQKKNQMNRTKRHSLTRPVEIPVCFVEILPTSEQQTT